VLPMLPSLPGDATPPGRPPRRCLEEPHAVLGLTPYVSSLQGHRRSEILNLVLQVPKQLMLCTASQRVRPWCSSIPKLPTGELAGRCLQICLSPSVAGSYQCLFFSLLNGAAAAFLEVYLYSKSTSWVHYKLILFYKK
jgi:hypothetical protein